MIDLSAHVALVTGASRGIGRATALALARAGADVAITYLNSPRDAEDVGGEILDLGRRTLVLKADFSEEDDARNAIRAIDETFGGLDVLVSNAAGGGFRPLMEVDAAHFAYAMAVNARAFMFLVQEAASLLCHREGRVKRAKVTTISSFGAVRALPMYGAIGATKAALESMTRHFALELGPRGVNVNCVRAGVVDTGALRSLAAVEAVLEERKKKVLAGDRNVVPEDVANAVLFLSSPLADMVQGETLVVDGGASIQP
ncbi:MAG: SDR family oxidoreductase [Deltaproteobacteria bacterium]|nr:SDR family oxidoreductase [Deltaproteobacteria bacterium]